MMLLSLSINNTPINPPASLNQTDTTAEKILTNAINIFLIAGILASVLVIVWSGITWITSGGDKQKLAAAKARITWAIIGLVIMLTAFGIIMAFNNLFGIDLLNHSS